MVQGCFSNPASPITVKSDTCNNICKENLVTCVYQTCLLDSSPVYITLTWSKTSYSHTLTLHSNHLFSHTISLYPSTFSLFRTRSGSKSIPLNQQTNPSDKIKLYWNFTQAKFTHPNSAEPESGFYLGLVTRRGRVEFFLGDLHDELFRRLGGGTSNQVINSAYSTLLSRREHVFDRRRYSTRAEFLGSTHLIEIECSSGALKVKFNGVNKLTVKRLGWKFRGNEKIFVNGITVEFFWDVFNWINNTTNTNNNNSSNNNNAVFVFQVGGGGVWPEMVGPEKKLMKKSSSLTAVSLSPAGSNASSVLQWAEDSDCGRSSSSAASSRSSGSCGGDGSGFSLVLYAWRR